MTSDERHARMDAARVCAELSVQDVWLRYVAMGGTGDAFDVDGYLQGLVALDAHQQDVLAQALNEALDERYRSYVVPLSSPVAGDGWDDDRLRRLTDELLHGQSPLRPPERGDEGP